MFNNHPLSTERHFTPYQLYFCGTASQGIRSRVYKPDAAELDTFRAAVNFDALQAGEVRGQREVEDEDDPLEGPDMQIFVDTIAIDLSLSPVQRWISALLALDRALRN